MDDFPVDPDVSFCLVTMSTCSEVLTLVCFILQSEQGKALEASKKEFQQTEKLKKLLSDCNIFLSREVPREILVFVIRYRTSGTSVCTCTCMVQLLCVTTPL